LTEARDKQEFKERWAKWCKCFDNNEVNSINSQITRMLWDYAIWNLINDSRQYIEKASDGTPLANGVLHNSINKWFFETQMTAIRRLIDEYGIEGKKGVYSLMSVLNDMIKNAKYLTRENIFELRNLQYDYAPLIEAESKWMNEQITSGAYAYHIPAKLCYEPCADLHKLIDILSRTSEEKREKSDTIDVNFLNRLKEDLSQQCGKFKNIVDKHYAHAATEESRNIINANDLKVTLQEYKKAHELICKCASFIQGLLMGRSTHFLPIPHPSLFLYWDKPIFEGKNPEILREIWKKYEEEARQWCCMPFDELRKKMEGVISNERY
jgi:hypothetical protein